MKKAFTLIEIIFIIVVVGILSSIAIQKFNSKDLLKGAEMIARDIEYTKHLAIIYDTRLLSDIEIKNVSIDRFKKGTINHIRQYWCIKFFDKYKDEKNNTINNPNYSIFKSTLTGEFKPTLNTAATDYLDKKFVLSFDANNKIFKGDINTSPRLDIKKNYGIDKIEFLGSCKGSTKLLFDEEGVIYGNTSPKLLQKLETECVIRLKSGNVKNCIIIHQETGYIKVSNNIHGIKCENYI